jgi:glutamine synthetase
MANATEIVKKIKDEEIRYVDLRFTDPRAQSYGKTATFMPKPVFGDNGSGMHVHQSVWKGSEPPMAGNLYAGLSETACSTSAAF